MDNLTEKLEDSKRLIAEITTKTASYVDLMTKLAQIWSDINSSVDIYKTKNEEASKIAEKNIEALGEKIKALRTAYSLLLPNSNQAKELLSQIQQNTVLFTTTGLNLASNGVISPDFLTALFEKYFGGTGDNTIKDKTGAIISGGKLTTDLKKGKDKTIESVIDDFLPGDTLGKKLLSKVTTNISSGSDTTSIASDLTKSSTLGSTANAVLSFSTVSEGLNVAENVVGNVAGGALSSIGTDAITDIAGKVAGPLGIIIKILQAITSGLSAIKEKVGESVSEVTSILTSDERAKTDSRLYGLIEELLENGELLNTNFVDLASDVISLVNNGANAFISEKELIENMTTLINQGVAYNIEQRALWMTLEDKIVSTFDAMDERLLRLILLLQQELTDTYMGVEASITRTLNSMFKDTLYLNSTYDTVWGNLTDTLANVDANLGTSIAYQVLLWLGSLSALGLSSEAAGGISSAINSLLTGNTGDLGDLGKTLLAMAAARQNMSFADLLVNGVNSGEDMSSLMKGIITVLQDIYSESKDNNVLLSEWGEVLNLSIADWKAISNLTESTITTLSGLNSYSQVDAKLEELFIENNLVGERTLAAERIENALENTWFSSGWAIAADDEAYKNWKTSEMITEVLDAIGGGGMLGTILGAVAGLSQTLLVLDAVWDPIANLINSDLGFTNDNTFSSFRNSSRTDISSTQAGTFLAEVFDEVLKANNYVAYGNIINLSKYATERSFTSDLVTMSSSYTTASGTTADSTSGNSTTTTDYSDAYDVEETASGSVTSTTPTSTVDSYTMDEIYKKLNADKGFPVRIINVDDSVIISTKTGGSTKTKSNYDAGIDNTTNAYGAPDIAAIILTTVS